MINILPEDYESIEALPKLYGKSDNASEVIQISYTDGSNQLVIDSALSTAVDLSVISYSLNQDLSTDNLSFYYRPVNISTVSQFPLNILKGPHKQEDGSYLVTVEIPSFDVRFNGYLIASYAGISTSDGLDLIQAPYPEVPDSLIKDKPSKRVILDYEELLDVLAPPNTRSSTGTVQSSFSKKGLNALANKDDKKRKDAVQGAVQQAVSRIRGLSEVLVTNHLGDELIKLQAWLTSIAIPDFTNVNIETLLADLTGVLEYTTGVTQDIIKLTTILEQYSIGLKGTTSSQNSGVVNQTAQAFRYTSNSVYDIESPTTLINTEYLIQQSTKSTFRQTGVDQLSCFNSWQRAEESIFRQSKNQYNYSTEGIYNGAKVKVGTYVSGTDNYLSGYSITTGPVPTGSSYNVLASGDIDFFSAMGNFLIRTFGNMANKVKNFVVKASEHIYIQAEDSLAIETKGDNLHLINRNGKIIIDAKQVIFKTDEPIEYYKGTGPLFFPAIQQYNLLEVPRYDLMMLPHLSVIDLMESGSLLSAVPDNPLYTVEASFLTLPEPPKTIIPPELLSYPKASPGATVPQPNNGIISAPVYPSA